MHFTYILYCIDFPCVPSYYPWFLVVVQLSVVISFSPNYLGGVRKRKDMIMFMA